MKISTKFIGVSAILVGAIALISGGSTLWRNQTEQATLEQYTQAKRRIELAMQIQNRRSPIKKPSATRVNGAKFW
jgi:hypothetical protein